MHENVFQKVAETCMKMISNQDPEHEHVVRVLTDGLGAGSD